MSAIKESLIENSKSAIIASIEIHNKPIFSYRYEICTILTINAWELLLKAFIAEFYPNVRLIRKDGSSKSFEECLSFISSELGKDFRVIEENLNKIYEYRCNVIHFYKDNIDAILFSLLHKSVYFYNEFIKKHFNIDLSNETNLILLPIGFKPFISPIDFLNKDSILKETSSSVQTFIKSIVTSTESLSEEGIEETILTGFTIAAINENRVKNADIIAAITKDPNKAAIMVQRVINGTISDAEDAQKISIEEESLFKTIYTMKYNDITREARNMFSDFKQGPKFNKIMNQVKENPDLHRKRYLDVVNKTGVGQDFYNPKVLDELKNHYTLK